MTSTTPPSPEERAALREHLTEHLTDGLYHDDCRRCLYRRAHGGNGITVADLSYILVRLLDRVEALEAALEMASDSNASFDADSQAWKSRAEAAEWQANGLRDGVVALKDQVEALERKVEVLTVAHETALQRSSGHLSRALTAEERVRVLGAALRPFASALDEKDGSVIYPPCSHWTNARFDAARQALAEGGPDAR